MKLRSESKAERNDPKDPGYWRTKFQEIAASAPSSPGGNSNDKQHVIDQHSAERVGSQGQSSKEYGTNKHRHDDAVEESTSDDESNLDEEEDDEDESNFGSEDDVFASFNWLEQMDGIITLANSTDSKPVQVGYCGCKLIRREDIRDEFLDNMEEPTKETCDLAVDLFDRYGRLRKEFKTHPVRKGSGVWQDEVDIGDLLLFESIRIDRRYRRRGLARKLVNSLLEKARAKSRGFFAFAAPGWLNDEVELETGGLSDEELENEGLSDEGVRATQHRHLKVSQAFWRSIGFRRVGLSGWFAMASASNHPCHVLAAEDDFDLPTNPNPSKLVLRPQVEALMRTLARSEAQYEPDESYEGHESNLLVEQLQEIFTDVAIGDNQWLVTDDHGNSILHLVAKQSEPKAVEWLLERCPGLLGVRNHRGETPLDALETYLESMRRMKSQFGTRFKDVSDDFDGHSDLSIACLTRLKGLDLSSMDDPSYLRLKFGCTCDQCVAGFFSPRMRFALTYQAEINFDILMNSFDINDGKPWVRFNRESLYFVRPSVRENMKTNKSMRQGFVQLCQHFAMCMKNEDGACLPSREMVLRELHNAGEWPPVSRNFLERGGTMFAVGSMLFDAARVQDEWAGDGDMKDVMEFNPETVFGGEHSLQEIMRPHGSGDDNGVGTTTDEYSRLPECRNDHEFGFVSRMCGYHKVGHPYQPSITG